MANLQVQHFGKCHRLNIWANLVIKLTRYYCVDMQRGVNLARFDKMAFKRRITTTFELPRDIMLDWPSIRMMGDEELVLSNHKGIAEYSKEQVRVKTGIGVVKISGRGLEIREISREDIVVVGKIDAVIFRDR